MPEFQEELPVPMPGWSVKAINERIAYLIGMNSYYRSQIDGNIDEISELRDRLVDFDPYAV